MRFEMSEKMRKSIIDNWVFNLGEPDPGSLDDNLIKRIAAMPGVINVDIEFADDWPAFPSKAELVEMSDAELLGTLVADEAYMMRDKGVYPDPYERVREWVSNVER